MRPATGEEKRAVLEQLRRDAQRLALEFALPLASVEAERPRVKRRYGICFDTGEIRIRLTHATSGRLLEYSALVDTLCHELAHLRHFDHSRRFKALYPRILERARRLRIYRPTPAVATKRVRAPLRRGEAGSSAPVQLDLFRRSPS